jgi:hypothetical protein
MKKTAVLLFALMGCAQEKPTTRVLVGGTDEIQAQFADGEVARGWSGYEAAIGRRVGTLETLNEIPLTVEDDPSPGAGPPGTTQIRFQIGKFAVSVDPDFSYLDGCIRKHMLHLRIQLEHDRVAIGETRIPLVELHLAGWIESTKPCVGVLNRSIIGFGLCQKICWTATREDIMDRLRNGLIGSGVAGTTALVMSRVLTPIAQAALALR